MGSVNNHLNTNIDIILIKEYFLLWEKLDDPKKVNDNLVLNITLKVMNNIMDYWIFPMKT